MKLMGDYINSTYCRTCGKQINYRFYGYEIKCSQCQTEYEINEMGLHKLERIKNGIHN
uniref:Uncharacterized protein n=1 Tax=viral metagenome TaxID=1070528 RepID=A0A6H1ZDA9_9ZZZZ